MKSLLKFSTYAAMIAVLASSCTKEILEPGAPVASSNTQPATIGYVSNDLPDDGGTPATGITIDYVSNDLTDDGGTSSTAILDGYTGNGVINDPYLPATGTTIGFVSNDVTDDPNVPGLILAINVSELQLAGSGTLALQLVHSDGSIVPLATLNNVRPDTTYHLMISDPMIRWRVDEGLSSIQAVMAGGVDGYTPLQRPRPVASTAADL